MNDNDNFRIIVASARLMPNLDGTVTSGFHSI